MATRIEQNDLGWTNRRFAQIERLIREMRAERRLASSDFTGVRVDKAVTANGSLGSLLRATRSPAALTLTSAVTAYGNAPDVEVVNGVAFALGQIAPTGTWTAGSVYTVASLPDGVTGPRAQKNAQAATNINGQVVRVLVNPAGAVQLIGPTGTAPAWVDLSALSWVTT